MVNCDLSVNSEQYVNSDPITHGYSKLTWEIQWTHGAHKIGFHKMGYPKQGAPQEKYGASTSKRVYTSVMR